MFSYSADCAKTWSPPRLISRVQSADVNDDGVATTADVTRLQASLNRSVRADRLQSRTPDVTTTARSTSSICAFVSRGVGQPVPKQPRLSQGATLAIDPQNGALQIAWRQFNDGVLPDAIVTVRSTNGGATVSAPTSRRHHQPVRAGHDGHLLPHQRLPDADHRRHRPRLSRLVGARLRRATAQPDDWRWARRPLDLHRRHSPGRRRRRSTTRATRAIRSCRRSRSRRASCNSSTTTSAKTCRSSSDRSSTSSRFSIGTHSPRIRHTIDVWAAQADPGGDSRVHRLPALAVPLRGACPARRPFSSSSSARRTCRSSGPARRRSWATTSTSRRKCRSCANGSTWSFNTAPTASPVFHGIWTDNRDIRPPANGLWTDYTPPNPPFARPAMSAFDPTQAIPACVPGQAGMRNQNIYTARITRGLVVGALGNTRRLGAIQRSFPVFAQNNSLDGPELPADDHQPAGGRAGVVQAVRAADDARRPGAAQVHCRAHGVRAIERSPRADQRQRRRDRGPGRRTGAERAAGHDRPESRSDQSGSRESRPREPRSRKPRPRERRGPQSGPRERDRPQSGPRESRPRKPRPGEPGPREHDASSTRRFSTPISRTPTSRTRTSRTPISRIPTSRTSIS